MKCNFVLPGTQNIQGEKNKMKKKQFALHFLQTIYSLHVPFVYSTVFQKSAVYNVANEKGLQLTVVTWSNSVREGNLIKCLQRKRDVTTVAKGNDPHYTIQNLFSLANVIFIPSLFVLFSSHGQQLNVSSNHPIVQSIRSLDAQPYRSFLGVNKL